MTKHTPNEVREKAIAAGLILYPETKEEARACMGVLPVGDQDSELLELSLAVLMELSMIVAVDGEDIYLDDEPMTTTELIETAVELLEDTITSKLRQLSVVDTWEYQDKVRFYTLLLLAVDMTGDPTCWEEDKKWRDAIIKGTGDEAYIAYSMSRILAVQAKTNMALILDAEIFGWENEDVEGFAQENKEITEYIRRLRTAYRVPLEVAYSWKRD